MNAAGGRSPARVTPIAGKDDVGAATVRVDRDDVVGLREPVARPPPGAYAAPVHLAHGDLPRSADAHDAESVPDDVLVDLALIVTWEIAITDHDRRACGNPGS